MKNIKLIVVGLLGVAALIFGVSAVDNKPGPVSVITGALSGPDISSPYLKWGAAHGVRVWSEGQGLKAATTTVCAIQSPAATSTLQSAGVKFDVSSTTASIITLAKATTAFATTTSIGTNYAIAANAQAFINASTSPSASAVEVFAPNTWFVVGMAGGTGTFSPTGSCHATFEEYISL